ncbi:MAG: metallophosphoesterase family protein [Bacteroidota bacterium]
MERNKVHQTIELEAGKVLVFGGVYSNLQALEALKSICESKGIPAGQVICTGDIVAYCAQPEASVQLIRDWGIHAIAGNVEINLREEQEDCGCNFNEGGRCDLFSRQWYPLVQSKLSSDSIQWFHQLPDFIHFELNGWKTTVVHGSYFDTSEFVFESSPKTTFKTNFEASDSHLILAGHCGLPFHRQIKDKLWLNAGVIGMPANDGTPRVWYMILDFGNDDFRFAHQSFEYDHRLAAELMRHHGLPESYANTLETGLWDNCEILPERETQLTGQEILL